MFITVNGTCQKSCFTQSLLTLVRMQAPIMSLSEEEWSLVVSFHILSQTVALFQCICSVVVNLKYVIQCLENCGC